MHRLNRPISPEQAAARLAQIAEATAGGPHRDLFLFAAAVALAGAEACAVRDRRPAQPKSTAK